MKARQTLPARRTKTLPKRTPPYSVKYIENGIISNSINQDLLIVTTFLSNLALFDKDGLIKVDSKGNIGNFGITIRDFRDILFSKYRTLFPLLPE